MERYHLRYTKGSRWDHHVGQVVDWRGVSNWWKNISLL